MKRMTVAEVTSPPRRRRAPKVRTAPSSCFISRRKLTNRCTEAAPAPANINLALQAALSRAAEPGEGDEEPEVLPPPDGSSDMKRSSPMEEHEEEPDSKRRVDPPSPIALPEYVPSTEPAVDSTSFTERAKYIPLRLTYEERKTLRLVSATIAVSDYTSSIDIAYRNKARRYHNQLQYIVAFLTGIIASTDYKEGQEVVENRNFEAHQPLIQQMLEIVRRYKITNPEKLRSEYGKLVYLMQDAVSAEIRPLLGVDIHRPIVTVYETLRAAGGLAVLRDPNLAKATMEILPDKKARHVIQHEIRSKEKAAEYIVKHHLSRTLSADTIRACLYSIGDNYSFLNSNSKPVEDCIALLQQHFRADHHDEGYSLAICEGTDGARLSHSHSMQYHFVLQSLTLWAAILEDMFRLWYLAEQDLLNEQQPYELRNTGQGLQRVQQSPRVYKAMHDILTATQAKLGNWVGSSVIHLGDHNVPNALVFIDKYTQVARILGPLVTTLRNLETLVEENEGLGRYLQAYGGIEKAKKDVLCDFFTHAFDGSGGDNFFDAGSCIDGRLTSAWNWCSQLANKDYYPLFRLTGFLSFDGQFDK